MKTIKTFLNQLEEPYRSQAIENAHEDINKDMADNTVKALESAFIWADTPQGHQYWWDYTKELKNRREKAKYPNNQTVKRIIKH